MLLILKEVVIVVSLFPLRYH